MRAAKKNQRGPLKYIIAGGLVVRGELLCEKPAGTPHALFGPVAVFKVAHCAKFLTFEKSGTSEGSLSHVGFPPISRSGIQSQTARSENSDTAQEVLSPGGNGIDMLDALVICLLLAMVLAPAVAAAQSGEGPHPNK